MNSNLPIWASELREYYLSGEAIVFLLHANVGDVFLYEEQPFTLQEFLYQSILKKSKEHVIYYDTSRGLTFPSPAKQKEFMKSLNTQLAILGETPLHSQNLPRSPGQVLPLLEKFLKIPNQNTAVIINYMETVVPAAEISFMSSEERMSLITLQRWASDQQLLNTDNIVIFVAENLADVNNRVVKNPQIVSLEIPLPELDKRQTFINHSMKNYEKVKLEMTPEGLAEMTSGLSQLQIDALFRQARRQNGKLTYELIRRRKKSIIEQECFGLVELVNTRYDLSVVGGMEKTKNILKKVARYVKEGPKKRVPMGLFFVGPMGTGKTFVAEAFAGESQLTCLKLKNFRDRWVGSTEANLEKIFNVVKALGPVMIIMDEVDRSMGGAANEGGDNGVSSRVYARMKQFMSDTSHRGNIIWVLMSNRPDKLDIDLTRAGRIDLKIPFFFPETDQDRMDVLRALIKKNKLDVQIDDYLPLAQSLAGYSGAEMEAILLIADEMTAEDKRKRIRDRDLEAAIHDFIPNRDDSMLEFMELLAIFQCSSRRLLPENYQDWSNEKVNKRLRELQHMVGSR